MDLFNLMAKLSLDGEGFEKGVKDADKQGKNLASKLEKSFNKIGKVAKVVFAGYLSKTVVGTIKNLVSATAQFGDTIDKQSQVLGMTRKQYQQWDYVLGQNGVSIDEMSTALKTMNAAIESNDDEVTKAFKDLGASVDYMKSLDMGGQLDYLIYQFQQMPDGIKKSQLAVKLFGRSGQTLLPLLNSSSESVYNLLQRFDELGLEMSDAEVDAAVKYGDALDDLRRTFNRLKTSIGNEFLPILTKAVDKITGYVGKLNRAYKDNGLKGVWNTIVADIKAIPWPTWKDVKDAAIGAWNTIVKGVTEDLPALVFGRTEDGKVAWPNWSELEDIALGLWNDFKDVVANFAGLIFGKNSDGSVKWPDWDTIKGIAETAWNTFTGIVADFAGLIFGKNSDGSVKWPSWSDLESVAIGLWDDFKDVIGALGGLVFGRDTEGNVKWPSWSDLEDIAIGLWHDFQDVVGAFGGLIFGRDTEGKVKWPTLSQLKVKAAELWGKLLEWVGSLGGLIFGRDENGDVNWPDWDTIKQTASKAWDDILDFVAKLPKLVFGEGTALGDGLTTALNLVKEVGSWAIENGEQAALAIAGIVGAFGISKLVGLIAAHPAIAALTALIAGATANLTGIEGLGSVATAIEAIGAAFLTATVVNNFVKFADALKNIFTGSAGGGWGAILGAIAAIGVLIYENWDTIEAGIEIAGAAIDTYIIQPLQSAFDSVTGWFNDNLVAPLTEAFNWLKENIINPVRDLLYEKFGIGTPSWRDNVRGVGMNDNQGNAYFASDEYQLRRDFRSGKITEGQFRDTMRGWGVSETEIEHLIETLKSSSDTASDSLDGTADSADSASSGLDSLTSAANSAADALNSIPSYRYDPEPRAKGAWYVPYDNYLARLHRGERVLTASQARHGDGEVNTHQIVQELKEAVSELVGSLTITLNKKMVGRVMGDTVSSRVHDNINFANDQRAYAHGR